MPDRRLAGRIRSFVDELRRRRVFRVLLAYAIVGVGAAEAAGIFLPALGFPGWAPDLVAALIVLGLPVAVGLAWAFDIVPDAGPAGTEVRTPAPGRPGSAEDDRAEWKRVQDLFFQALERAESERDDFLRETTGGDVHLLAEVRSLLGAHGRRGPLDDLEEKVIAPLRDPAGAAAGPGHATLDELEGTAVRHYEIEERLGGGGMGVVYRARDTRLGRSVALKFLNAHLLTSPHAKQRFLSEAQAAAGLDHVNLCTIHEIGETEGGLLFIAMACYDGETLKRRLARGRIPVGDALDITGQVAAGLAHAAEAGIIHRDVKPDNLILLEDGTVKIVDFGVAKVLDEEVTREGVRLGTVAYMSPEQTRGERVDQRTDIWSLGVVLFEMLTGERPFQGGSDQAIVHAILNEAPKRLEELAPEVPSGVVSLVTEMLQKDPARRPGTATRIRDRVARLVEDPAALAAPAASARIPSGGERRLVTVLACNIEGLETLMETVGPQDVDERLHDLRERVRTVVEDFGGVLNDFTENGFVALFGVPVAHEDDALRAVRAALEMHRRLPGDGTLALRSAVGSGQVTIQALDSGARPYRVGGDVTREVGRLAAAAGRGDTLVSRELERLVTPFMETEVRPAVELSPGDPPISPVAVTGESDANSRFDVVPRGGLTRFVGRTEELRTLLTALARVDSGSGQVVAVVGDAGVGKSRLLHEFRTSLAEDGVRYVQGRCQAQGGLTPFLPFIDCVRAILGTGRTRPDQVHDQVVARTRALASELEVYVPILLHLLSVESDTHPLPDYLEGEDLKAAVAEALVSVFTVGSRGQPLVLFLEDWHWVDGGSADVLHQLTEMAPAYPLLIVVTSRPTPEGGVQLPRGQVHLDLAPLDPDSTAEVMRAALRGSRVDEGLAQLIAEKTGGNPFFIEELCHTLLETGSVVLEDGHAVRSGAVENLAIPDTVQAVLKTRLDRLDPESREVLRSASVIGRDFGRGLLGRVVPSPSRLRSALDALRASGLIQRTSLVPEPMYRFKHALTRDVSYESLLERQRRERHALVGQAMEELYAGREDEFADQLASHFAAAEDWDRAVQYGFAAAERATSLWRIDEAMAALQRTGRCIDRRGPDAEGWRRDRIRLLLEEERHLETLGRRDEQRALIGELHELVEGQPSPEAAIVMVREGELATLTGRFDDARQAFHRAMDVADACGATDEHTLALRGMGHAYWRTGQYELARGPLEDVVARDRKKAEASGETSHKTTLLRDLINLGRVRRELGEFDAAEEIGEEVRRLADETGNPVDDVYVSNYLGHLLRAMGRPEEAIRAFREGSEGFHAAHLPVRHAFHLLGAAALLLEMGQVEESLSTYENAVELSRRAGRADNLANALNLHADALLTVGRADDAMPVFTEAVGILRRLGVDATLAAALGKLAQAAEAAGDPSAADHWAEAREVRTMLGDGPGILEAAEREARLRRGQPDRARDLLQIALNAAEDRGDAAARARVLNSLGLLEFRDGEMQRAVAHLQASAELLGGSVTAGTNPTDPQAPETAPDDLVPVLNALGAALLRLDRREEAVAVLERALAAASDAENPGWRADALSTLGAARRADGNLAAAYDRYEQCLEARKAAGDRAGEGWALLRLAQISVEARSRDRARAFATESRLIARETGDRELERQSTEITFVHGGVSPGAPPD